ncbi:MAG TPA: SRPBCC family protein [Marmoricola sp.]|nr:SRPBCC family protein [Marmoricola sp.]
MLLPTPIRLGATVEMAASPEQVWTLVSDFARMPEFSPELRRAFVLGGPGLGTRIIGINRRGRVTWPTTSTVVRWEPGRAVAWKVRESGATWVYELEPSVAGTLVTGRRVLRAYGIGNKLVGPLVGGVVGHDHELARGITETLHRIKAVAER